MPRNLTIVLQSMAVSERTRVFYRTLRSRVQDKTNVLISFRPLVLFASAQCDEF